MSTRALIGITDNYNQTAVIYCHNNGQPEYTGNILLKHYNTLEKIKQLLSLGNISCLGEKPDPEEGSGHSFRNPEPGVTVSYTRDRGDSWKENKAKDYKSLGEIPTHHVSYVYLYDTFGKEWIVIDTVKDIRQRLTPQMCKEDACSNNGHQAPETESWVLENKDHKYFGGQNQKHPYMANLCGLDKAISFNSKEAAESKAEELNGYGWDFTAVKNEQELPIECTEVCPHCEYENTILWNPKKDGYQATCQECGKLIMLCDECMHADDNPSRRCNWDEKTNCFRKPYQAPPQNIKETAKGILCHLRQYLDQCDWSFASSREIARSLFTAYCITASIDAYSAKCQDTLDKLYYNCENPEGPQYADPETWDIETFSAYMSKNLS